MKTTTRLFLQAILGCTLALPGTTYAEAQRARLSDEVVRDQQKFNKLIEDSTEVYNAIVRAPNNQVPSTVLQRAKCIAVIPNAITGAIVVGGTHGEGVASCKSGDSSWSQPAAISLNQGSFGIQAGAKSTDLVIFFQTNEAVQALKRGNFTFGTEVSAVAGNYDSAIDTSSAGALIYTRTEGLFAGASVNGGKIGYDQDTLTRYYGKKVTYTSLLEGKETPDSAGSTQKLTSGFPR